MIKKILSFVSVFAMVGVLLCGCNNTFKTQVDTIIKNANIYTSDESNPYATAIAIKDDKFVYVGDEEGLKNFEGPVVDAGGKTILPGFMDAHTHLPASLVSLTLGEIYVIEGEGKDECLTAMKKVVDEHPDAPLYSFMLQLKDLQGEILTKEDLDTKVSANKEIFILESEVHSCWANSKALEVVGYDDNTPDMKEGLSYLVRQDGHITGNAYEGMSFELMMRHAADLDESVMRSEFKRWIEFCKKAGVTAVFEAGTPGSPLLTEKGLKVLCEMDKAGELPIYINSSYMVYNPAQAKDAVEYIAYLNKTYNTEHVKVDTFKIMMDGTLAIKTAALVEPYEGTDYKGETLFNSDEIASILKQVNEKGFNFHTHCVGEGAIRTVLDGIEKAKNELGDNFNVKCTIAHNEIMADSDILRFKELGVIANCTPWWNSGACISGGYEKAQQILGERADKLYRAKSLCDSGAIVTWSSDNTMFGDFECWSPMLGFEVGMTREITEQTVIDPMAIGLMEKFPSSNECLSIEDMIKGYTINAAYQINMDDVKGSITVGKDADYQIYNEDLFEVSPSTFSHISPSEVYFAGKQVFTK